MGASLVDPILPDTLVAVRRQWNDAGRIAGVRLRDLNGFHWSRYSGGVFAPTPRAFIHAYMACDAVVEGELAHSCRHGRGPHSIKVCIVKRDNPPQLFRYISELAPLDAGEHRQGPHGP